MQSIMLSKFTMEMPSNNREVEIDSFFQTKRRKIYDQYFNEASLAS